MRTQNATGKWTEHHVREHLKRVGLEAMKPKRDVGVDLEVWHASTPTKKVCVQIKGRGKQQKNGRHRWFQIRMTPNQRKDAVAAGLDISEAWRKKVALCEFFVLVSQKHDECWVFPATVIPEIIQVNKAKYGKRADNLTGKQVELDLDLVHEGKPLADHFLAYRDNFTLIYDAVCAPGVQRDGD